MAADGQRYASPAHEAERTASGAKIWGRRCRASRAALCWLRELRGIISAVKPALQALTFLSAIGCAATGPGHARQRAVWRHIDRRQASPGSGRIETVAVVDQMGAEACLP
jgi:hypothetical protein